MRLFAWSSPNKHPFPQHRSWLQMREGEAVGAWAKKAALRFKAQSWNSKKGYIYTHLYVQVHEAHLFERTQHHSVLGRQRHRAQSNQMFAWQSISSGLCSQAALAATSKERPDGNSTAEH